MAEEVSLEKIYWELKDLRKEVDTIFHALIPEEQIEESELAELKRIDAEMNAGKRVKLEDALRGAHV